MMHSLQQQSQNLKPLSYFKLINFYTYVGSFYFCSTKCVLNTDPATMRVRRQLLSSRFVWVYYNHERILNGASPVAPELPQAEDIDVKYPIF